MSDGKKKCASLTADQDRLREAAKAFLTAWDEATTEAEDDCDFVHRLFSTVDGLRNALAKEGITL